MLLLKKSAAPPLCARPFKPTHIFPCKSKLYIYRLVGKPSRFGPAHLRVSMGKPSDLRDGIHPPTPHHAVKRRSLEASSSNSKVNSISKMFSASIPDTTAGRHWWLLGLPNGWQPRATTAHGGLWSGTTLVGMMVNRVFLRNASTPSIFS